MSNTTHSFVFSPNFNLGTNDMTNENVFISGLQNNQGFPPPPIDGNFWLTDNTGFLLTDGTNLLLT